MVEVAFADAEEGIEGLFKLTQSPQALPPGFTPTGVCQMRALQDTMGRIVIILHPRPRDTGKFAALGPNIMLPKGCLLPPEGRRAGGSRPEGGNRQPEGDIMWPAGG